MEFNSNALRLKERICVLTYAFMDGRRRADIKPGVHVRVVQKQDQGSGRLTEGIVSDNTYKVADTPSRIKVRLTSGIVGRVKEVLS